MILSNTSSLLNVYLALSLCVVLFDLTVMLTAGKKERMQIRYYRELRSLLETQFARLDRNMPLDEDLQYELTKRLFHVDQLLVFSQLAEEYAACRPAHFYSYISQSGDVFQELSVLYQKKEAMYRATYAWMLSRCASDVPSTYRFLLDCVLEKSIYCRENALTAFYMSGNEEKIVTAFKLMSRNEINHSQKLLSDGLLSFSGDKHNLCKLLWKQFHDLSNGIQHALIDFMKQISADYRSELIQLLKDESTNDELCLAILRYFGKIPYTPAYKLMMQFIEQPRRKLWEYAAVSASSLSNYPTKDAVYVLKRALGNSNWYIRYNSADSLVSMKLPPAIFADILNGDDKFAKEMLVYMWKEEM